MQGAAGLENLKEKRGTSFLSFSQAKKAPYFLVFLNSSLDVNKIGLTVHINEFKCNSTGHKLMNNKNK